MRGRPCAPPRPCARDLEPRRASTLTSGKRDQTGPATGWHRGAPGFAFGKGPPAACAPTVFFSFRRRRPFPVLVGLQPRSVLPEGPRGDSDPLSEALGLPRARCELWFAYGPPSSPGGCHPGGNGFRTAPEVFGFVSPARAPPPESLPTPPRPPRPPRGTPTPPPRPGGTAGPGLGISDPGLAAPGDTAGRAN